MFQHNTISWLQTVGSNTALLVGYKQWVPTLQKDGSQKYFVKPFMNGLFNHISILFSNISNITCNILRKFVHPSYLFFHRPGRVRWWQRTKFFFFFFFFSFFSRGPLLDWLGQIMLYSHWSTQTGSSKHARVPATNKTVLCTLITV